MNAKALFCRQHRASPGCAPRGKRGVGTAAALLVSLFLSFSATADPQKPERQKNQGQPGAAHQLHQSTQQQRPPTQKDPGISAQQAVSIAKQRQQGKVLSVKRSNGSYKVKMLHQGQVRYVTVAAD